MAKKVPIKLQGHEKFILRDGWLYKGINAVALEPGIFRGKIDPSNIQIGETDLSEISGLNSITAADIFGVGSNMVKSIRYWLRAMNVTYEIPNKGTFLTPLGKLILEYDPYLEDIFTVWILHYHLAMNSNEATTWYLFFNECDVRDMTRGEILQVVDEKLMAYCQRDDFSKKSLKNDVDLLLHMYCGDRNVLVGSDPEDKNQSAFSQLGLIQNIDNHFSKVMYEDQPVTEWLLLYLLSQLFQDRESLSIDSLIQGTGSAFRIFQIDAISINSVLDKLEARGYIQLNRTAGLDMIYKSSDFSPEDIFKDYFSHGKGKGGWGVE